MMWSITVMFQFSLSLSLSLSLSHSQSHSLVIPLTCIPTGSCVLAGYTECCNDSVCLGQPVEDCYCDPTCHVFGDCCEDINATCPAAVFHPSGQFSIYSKIYDIL